MLTSSPFRSYIGFDWANNKVNIIGKGDNPVRPLLPLSLSITSILTSPILLSQIPLTTRADIARFLSHALTTFPPSSLANATYHLQASTLSFNAAVALYEETHPGKKVAIDYTSREEASKYIEEHPGLASVLQYLRLSWDLDAAPKEEETANGLWKEWNPTQPREVIAKL